MFIGLVKQLENISKQKHLREASARRELIQELGGGASIFMRRLRTMENKPKEVWKEKITCPYCKKKLIAKKTKKLITKAEPAEYEEKVCVEKDSQTTLKDKQ